VENCEYFEELISAAVDGELTDREEDALHAHLEMCESCRAYYEALRAISAAAQEDLTPPPVDFTARVMARVRAGSKKKKQGKLLRFPVRSLALAAAAAIVLWAGFRVAPVFAPKGGTGASTPMMAASQVERAAGAASDEEPPQAAEENGLYAAAIPAPAAAPAEEAGDRGLSQEIAEEDAAAPEPVTITVREDAVWYNGEELSPEELEEALLRDGAPGVRLVDESADGDVYAAVLALLERLDIPVWEE